MFVKDMTYVTCYVDKIHYNVERTHPNNEHHHFVVMLNQLEEQVDGWINTETELGEPYFNEICKLLNLPLEHGYLDPYWDTNSFLDLVHERLDTLYMTFLLEQIPESNGQVVVVKDVIHTISHIQVMHDHRLPLYPDSDSHPFVQTLVKLNKLARRWMKTECPYEEKRIVMAICMLINLRWKHDYLSHNWNTDDFNKLACDILDDEWSKFAN